MTTLVLIVLAVMWIAVLLPPYLRSRSSGRPSDSISSFQRQLSVLERSSPSSPSELGHRRAPAGHLTLAQAQARRRLVAGTLALLAVLTFVVGVFEPGMRVLLVAHLLLDGLLVGYLAALHRARSEAAEREMKVRFLPATAPGPSPVRQLAVARRAVGER